jgi:hypothetical protein
MVEYRICFTAPDIVNCETFIFGIRPAYNASMHNGAALLKAGKREWWRKS